MGSPDGHVLGPPTKILDTGPDAQRFNIVLAGDGYVDEPTAQQAFKDYCTNFVAHLTTRPWYPVIGRVINVHRLDVASNQPGLDIPPPCAGSPVSVNTYFDGTVRCDPNDPGSSWVEINWDWAWEVFNQRFPGYGFAVVALNTTAGGGYAVSDIAAVGARSQGSYDVLLHEMGHAIAPLGDNYILQPSTAPAGEPPSKNLTAQTNLSEVKWKHWFGVQPGEPPVMKNPDCNQHDARPNPFGDDHLVGLFESSYYFCGWFRPTYECRMRRANSEFCPVCLEAMHAALSTYASPIQNFDVVVPGGGDTLEFGPVASGSTVRRSFEVRNVRGAGTWPAELDVTISIGGAEFAFAPGTELNFKMPAPIEQATYSRTVEVMFTTPPAGSQPFTGQVTVAVEGIATPAQLNLHATSVRPPVQVAVLVVDAPHDDAFVEGLFHQDFVAAMKAVFRDPNPVLGIIKFPRDSAVPAPPSFFLGVKASFGLVYPLSGYKSLVAYFSLAGDADAGSAQVRQARQALIRNISWSATSGGAGGVANGLFEVGPAVFDVARENGVESSAIAIIDLLPQPVDVAVLAIDPQQPGGPAAAYLSALERRDYVAAMREVLRVPLVLGTIVFPHDSRRTDTPGAIDRIWRRFIAAFPKPQMTRVTYFSPAGEVGTGSAALRDARRELIRRLTWTSIAGENAWAGFASIASASYEVGPEVFDLATQHGFPYDALMVVLTSEL